MTGTQARSITTNQSCVHQDLRRELAKHQKSEFKRPIAQHTEAAFLDMLNWLEPWQGKVIIDACCGVGESTINLAAHYPNAKVIGIDKSIARLSKHNSYAAQSATNANKQNIRNNYLLLQADLNDFWRLLLVHVKENRPEWRVVQQFILYPNPYPKKAQLGKRWHASALFPVIVELCANIEVRSNWKLYLEEFSVAAQFYGLSTTIEPIINTPEKTPFTPFERKYLEANQSCFKLLTCR
jgi:tRNA G46 methylase TrmB